MLNQPLVSIIVIFYNAQPFIGEAIASIFQQTYKNWELILVDDGSTDHSTTIAQFYAHQFPKQIQYLEHKSHQNQGMSMSRNLGIRHANGDFIGFLDADDVWLPYKLEQQIELLNRYPEAGMVYGRLLFWYSWDKSTKSQNQDYFCDLGFQSDSLIPPPLLFKEILKDRYQKPAPSDALIRRQICDKIDFENFFRSLYEDQVFFLKVSLDNTVYLANANWTKYRKHQQSCTANYTKKESLKFREQFLIWVQTYIEAQVKCDPDVIRVIKRELWKLHHPYITGIIRGLWPYKEYLENLLIEKLNRHFSIF